MRLEKVWPEPKYGETALCVDCGKRIHLRNAIVDLDGKALMFRCSRCAEETFGVEPVRALLDPRD